MGLTNPPEHNLIEWSWVLRHYPTLQFISQVGVLARRLQHAPAAPPPKPVFLAPGFEPGSSALHCHFLTSGIPAKFKNNFKKNIFEVKMTYHVGESCGFHI